MNEVVALYGRAVPLTDRSVPDIPGIPPSDAQAAHFGEDICGMLIDGKDLADAGLPGLAAKRADGELPFAEVVFSHHMVDTDGVGRSAVLIPGARVDVFIAVIENVVNIVDQISVCFGHGVDSFLLGVYRIRNGS